MGASPELDKTNLEYVKEKETCYRVLCSISLLDHIMGRRGGITLLQCNR